mmetsp:Transcript_23529/g.61989  ORF Transcript_23529/g.61989 Transcript_23529/m.61989 type:complete len:280 (+) Transcript_23529:610-1449(+)
MLQAHLLRVLGRLEMVIHLLLLHESALVVFVAARRLDALHAVDELRHQLRLLVHSLLQLRRTPQLLPLLRLGVLDQGGGVALLLFPGLDRLLLQVLLVGVVDLHHGLLGLLLLPLELLLLLLHLLHDLVDQLGLLSLLLVLDLLPHLAIVVELLVPGDLLLHDLLLLLSLAHLLHLLPALELQETVVVVPHVLLLDDLLLHPLGLHLLREVHRHLLLQGLGAHLRPHGVLLVHVGGVLVHLRPVHGRQPLQGVRPDQARAGQRGAAPAAHAEAGVRGDP